MIGDLNERFELYEGTKSYSGSGSEVTYSDTPDATVWGKAVSADSRVRERFDSLDSTVTDIIKLAGKPALDYAEYKIVRVGDSQKFKPEAPPTDMGEYNERTYVGVERV